MAGKIFNGQDMSTLPGSVFWHLCVRNSFPGGLSSQTTGSVFTVPDQAMNRKIVFSCYIRKDMALPQMKLCNNILINFLHNKFVPVKMKE